MDPLTAALTLANSALLLATKIWDATPADQQKAEASQWAQFILNIGAFITGLQNEIQKALPK